MIFLWLIHSVRQTTRSMLQPHPPTPPSKKLTQTLFLAVFLHRQHYQGSNPTPHTQPPQLTSNSFRQSNELEDFVYFYKANIDLEPFRLGNDAFWKVHSTFFYTEDELEEHREQNGTAEEQAAGKRKRILKIEKVGCSKLNPPPNRNTALTDAFRCRRLQRNARDVAYRTVSSKVVAR